MGRNKSYDEDVVLDKAMMTFWERGYDNVSVRQLEEVMGINQFSIYSSFGSKGNLFHKSLERYSSYIESRFLKNLKSENAGLDQIREFLLEYSLNIQVGRIPNGCLMVNTTSEMTSKNAEWYGTIKAYFKSIEEVFVKVLSKEKAKGNISVDIKKGALYLLGIAQSISIMSKVQSRQEIEHYITFVMQSLK